MKIKCPCGNILRDQTDYLPYKAYIISDVDYFNLWDKIDEYVYRDNENKEKAVMELRNTEVKVSLISYQCNQCGRIIINDKNGRFHFFYPEKNSEENIDRNLFNTKQSKKD